MGSERWVALSLAEHQGGNSAAARPHTAAIRSYRSKPVDAMLDHSLGPGK